MSMYPTGPSCNITVFADTLNLRPSVFLQIHFLPSSLLAIAFIFFPKIPRSFKIFIFSVEGESHWIDPVDPNLLLRGVLYFFRLPLGSIAGLHHSTSPYLA